MLGEQIAEERSSNWHRAWELLRQGFPLVEASFVPLFVLVVAWLVGVNTTAAITAGLVTNGLLLIAMGWIASVQSGNYCSRASCCRRLRARSGSQ